MKKNLLFAAVLTAGSMAGVTLADQMQAKKVADLADANLKIGFVDSFEAMRNCEPGIKAGKELEAQRDTLSKAIKEDEQKYTQAVNEYKSKSATMSEAARDKEQQKIVKMERDLKAKVEESEESLKLSMQRTTEKLAKDIEQGIVNVAKETDLDAIVDKMTGRVVYAKDKLDFTSHTIKQMNKQYAQKVAQNKDEKGNVRVAAKDAKAPSAA